MAGELDAHLRAEKDRMIRERIRQFYPNLTRSQRRLADFVVASYWEVAFMTASNVAELLSVNEATVIRFAQRLGYPGYPEFLQDIQDVVREELAALGDSSQEAELRESLLRRHMRYEIDSLRRVVSHILPELAEEVQNALQGARRIFVLGQGVSAPLAQLLSTSLHVLGISATSPLAETLSLATMLDQVGGDWAVVGSSGGPEGREDEQ